MNFAPTEEQLMVRDMVRKLAESQIKPVAAELDHTHRHPEEICRKLGEMGIMGVSVPTEYGGADMDLAAKRFKGLCNTVEHADPTRWTICNGDNDLRGHHYLTTTIFHMIKNAFIIR